MLQLLYTNNMPIIPRVTLFHYAMTAMFFCGSVRSAKTVRTLQRQIYALLPWLKEWRVEVTLIKVTQYSSSIDEECHKLYSQLIIWATIPFPVRSRSNNLVSPGTMSFVSTITSATKSLKLPESMVSLNPFSSENQADLFLTIVRSFVCFRGFVVLYCGKSL